MSIWEINATTTMSKVQPLMIAHSRQAVYYQEPLSSGGTPSIQESANVSEWDAPTPEERRALVRPFLDAPRRRYS